MKRFRFPLQPVAVLRAHRELRAREAFAAAVQAYTRSEQELAETRARVARYEAALAERRQKPFPAAEAAQALAAYRHECAQEVAAERAMLTARSAMQQRRAEYLDAHRNVEIVKRLEQKARTEHQLEANRDEQAEFDDFAGRSSHLRRTALST